MKSSGLLRRWCKYVLIIAFWLQSGVLPAAVFAAPAPPAAASGVGAKAKAEVLPSWAKAEIEALLEEGVVELAAGGTMFQPEVPLTRADAAIWLLKLAESAERTELQGSSVRTFMDLQSYARKAELERAAQLGLIEGYEDGTFRPSHTITRAELAVILQRVLVLGASQQAAFADQNAIPSWAVSAVNAISGAGIIRGYEDYTYRPANRVTRAEAAVMLHRSLPSIIGKQGLLRVTVTTADAKPLPGATYRIHAKGKRSYAASGTTDAAGKLEAKLPYGVYEVSVTGAGVIAYQQIEFNKQAASMELRASPSAVVAGRVTGNAGQAKEGVVVAFTTNPTFFAVTGLDGTFRAQLLPERTYSLTMVEYDKPEAATLDILDQPGRDQACGCRIIDVKEAIQSPAAGQSAEVGELSTLDGRIKPNVSSGGGNSSSGSGSGGSHSPGDLTPPAVPTGLQAAAGDRQAVLSWTANTDADLAGYKVYVSQDQGSTWAAGINVNNVTSYVMQQLVNGTAYRIAVTAYDHTGNESARSAPVDVTPSALPDQTPPAAPANLSAVAGHQSVVLSWSAVTDIDLAGYRIYQTSDGGATWHTAANAVTGTSHTVVHLTNGTQYGFAVSAFDLAGNESARSNTAAATPVEPLPPAPRGLQARPGNGQVTLSWQANTDLYTMGYSITALSAGDNGQTYNETLDAGGLTTFHWAGLTNGTAYRFILSAYNESGGYSEAVSITATPQGDHGPDVTPPAVPTGFAGTTSGNQADFIWQANSESDLAGYKLYVYSEGLGGWFSIVGHIEPNRTSLSFRGLPYGTPFLFALSAYDVNGNESDKSSPVELTATEEPDTIPPAAPTGLQASPGDRNVRLTWSSNPEGDIAGYKVYTSSNGGATWNTGVLAGDTLTYQVSSLTNRQAYHFAITAIDTSGNESPKSQAVSATPMPADQTPPSPPAGLNGSAVDGTAILTWFANEESDLAGYRIYTSADGGATWNAGIDARTLQMHTVAGLTDGANYTFAAAAYDSNGNESAKSAVVHLTPRRQAIPQDPANAAPPISSTSQPSFNNQIAFLYTGPHATQAGVIPGAIRPAIAGVLRGKVLDAQGQPLAGAKVTLLNHPELGQTLSRNDGAYDLVVNGTGKLTLQFSKEGYMTVQRGQTVGYGEYTSVEDIVLRAYDSKVTVLDLTDAQEMQVAQGTPVSDEDGARTSTLLVPRGTSATMTLPDGTVQPLTEIHFRATEYTVGSNGKEAMPGELPQNVGYTYAVELSADEAVAAGAVEVTFSQPLYHYVDNFLGFPAGIAVPNAYYDRKTALWIPAKDGRVIRIISIDGGTAQLDTDGDGAADDAAKLSAIGVTAEEQEKLASLYPAGHSLWRVPIPHFTPWDHNWPYGPPADAIGPPGWAPKNTQPDPREEPCKQRGSIIGCEDQTLGEEIPIPGTGYRLRYQSDRTEGYVERSQVTVPVTGASLPASLKRITVTTLVAGNYHTVTLPKTLNQSYTFTWDGTDGFGRKLTGEHRYHITVNYHYQAEYYGFGPVFEASWARVPTNFAIIGNRQTEEIAYGQEYAGMIESPVNPYGEMGIAGWSFHGHHMFDSAAAKLIKGDGETQRKDSGLYGTLSPQGRGQGGGQQGQYHVLPQFYRLVGSNSYFLAKHSNRPDELAVIRVAPDHSALKVATYPSGSTVREFAVAPDGTLYLSYYGEGILKKGPNDSEWRRVVGRGLYGSPPIPDGTLGTTVGIYDVQDLVADSDGNIYFEGWHAITTTRTEIIYYRLDAQGIVHHFGAKSYGPDSGPASSPNIGYGRITVSPNGTLYVLDHIPDSWGVKSRIRRITPEGRLELVAGEGSIITRKPVIADGQLATESRFYANRGISIDGQENIYMQINLGDSSWGEIFKITRDGKVHLLDFSEAKDYAAKQIHSSSQVKLAGVDVKGKPIYQATTSLGSTFFNIGADTTKANVPDDDSVTLSRIDTATGRHHETLHAVTGAVLERYGYDAAGRLISITDAAGNVTMIERNAEGRPTAITAPGGQRTTLIVDEHNQLLAVIGAGQFRYDMTYDGKGLLKTVTDPNRHLSEYSYDTKGLLIEARTPTGGLKTITRTELSDGVSVAFTDAAGRQTLYETRKIGSDAVRTVTEPGGARSIVVYKSDGSKEMTYTDGTTVTQRFGFDPRYGNDAPVLTQMVVTTPDGRIVTHTENRVVVKDSEGRLQSLTVTFTTNGAVSTIKYDAAARTYTETSPEGTVKVSTLDGRGRIIREEYPNEPIAPVTYSFDERGRIGRIEQGAQSMTYIYNAGNQLIAEVDESGNRKEYTYNADGYLRTVKLPSGKTYTKDSDGNGHTVKLTMPDGTIYDQQYNSLNQFQGFGPQGQPAWITMTHDAAGMLDYTTMASGRTLDYSYEAGGARRISSMSDSDVQRAFQYSDGTDRVAQITAEQAGRPSLRQSVGYTYAGTEVRRMTLEGAVNAAFDYTFDTAKNVTNITNVRTTVTGLVYGQPTTIVHDTAIGWDRDEQMTRFGPFTFHREPVGMIGTVTDGRFTIENQYDELGKIKQRDYLWNGQLHTSSAYTYNPRGFLEHESVTGLASQSIQSSYEYDTAGQLKIAARSGTEGARLESYEYDDNRNLRSKQIDGGTEVVSSYSSLGMLQSVGSTAYVFDADGFLQRRGDDTFRYGIRGELLEATVTGVTYQYAYDALGRRTAREDANGVTEKYLYGHPEFIYMITASIDTNGVMTNYYYNDDGLLVGFERGGQRYYAITDNVGTPREVLDSSGTIVKKLRYDSFGTLLSDSAPAFELVIGYAGGLEDRAIRLVRFGARDYDPASGRWTARDPLLLDSGEPNLYAYVGNNPIVLRDPCGLFCVGASLYGGVGVGGKICITDEGVSSCFEAGVGAGGGLEIDPFEGLSDGGTSFEAAAKAQYGPLKAEVGGKYFKAFDPCQEGAGKLIAKLGAGPIQVDLKDLSKSAVKGKEADLKKSMKELFKPAAKLEAAAKVKICAQAKW